MNDLHWHSFDGTKFQELGNALLFFEVSKHALLFSAAGKDGGVDQLFEGEYGGQKGLWRFQDKFHNSGKKSQDISELKRDIKNDIKENYQGEDNLVYITNINLTPAKYREVLDAGLVELARIGITNCSLSIWHFPNISAILVAHPLIKDWFWNSDNILLETFENYFKDPLSKTDSYFRNSFFGRQKPKQDLNDFLADTESSGLALVANGGYGKTRLVIEFFKTISQNNEEWIPLVISHSGFNAANFTSLLRTKTKFLLLIDDAHKVPELTSEVVRIVKNSNGHHKFLLTTRPTTFLTITNKLATHNSSIAPLGLLNLSNSEAKEMFSHELPWLTTAQLSVLSDGSKGIPNVILAMIKLIKSGKKLSEISGDSAFIDSVNQIIQEAVLDIFNRTLIPQKNINGFIKLLSIIAPVPYDDENIQFLCKIVELRIDEMKLLINELKMLSLIQAGYYLAIRPDPYSEAILGQMLKKNQEYILYVLQMEGSEVYQDKILKNLVIIEDADERSTPFVNKLIDEYVNSLNDIKTPVSKIKSIYNFIGQICLKRPDLCVASTKKLFILNTNLSHPLHQQKGLSPGISHFDELVEICKKQLVTISNFSDYSRVNKKVIYELILKFIELDGKIDLLKQCYSFNERDFTHYRNDSSCCERQQFLQKKISKDFSYAYNDAHKIDICLSGSETLLNLEFNLQEFFDRQTMTFHFGKGTVAYCSHIIEIRTDTLRTIFSFIDTTSLSIQKSKALEILLRFHHYATGHFWQNEKFNLHDEIILVLSFLKEYVEKEATVVDKISILNTIHREVKKDIKPEYQPLLSEIREKALLSSSMAEQLEKELLNKDHSDIRENQENRFRLLIEQSNSILVFSEILLEVKSGLKDHDGFYNYQKLIDYISTNHPENRRSIFATIQQRFPQEVGDSLGLIRDEYKDQEYFYSVLEWLWQRKNDYMRSFYWLLTFGRRDDRTYYKVEDLQYFRYAVDRCREEPVLFEHIKYHLMDYAYLDKVTTFELIDILFRDLPENMTEEISYLMFERAKRYSHDFKEEVMSVYEKNIDKIKLGKHGHNEFLQFIELEFGFCKLLDFIETYIDRTLERSDYWTYDLERLLYVSEHSLPEEKISNFIVVFERYLVGYLQHHKKFRYLLSIFRPDINLTKEMADALKIVIDKNKNNYATLMLVAKAVQMFHNRSEQWLLLMCFLAERIIESSSNDVDLLDVFGSDYYNNNGSKSKTNTVFYPEDVFKKKLLNEVINHQNLHKEVVGFLLDARKKVEQVMQQDSDEAELENEW